MPVPEDRLQVRGRGSEEQSECKRSRIRRPKEPLRSFCSLSRSLFSVRRIFCPLLLLSRVSSNAGQFTLCGASLFVGRAHMMHARSVSHGVKIPTACRSDNSSAPLDGHGICTALFRSELADQTFCIRDSLSRRSFEEGSRQKRLRTTRELASTCVPPSRSTRIGILTPSDRPAFAVGS